MSYEGFTVGSNTILECLPQNLSGHYKRQHVCAKSLQSCPILCDPLDAETARTVACQASLSVGFSRQEFWSGLSCPPKGDLLEPGTEPTSHVSCIGREVLYR